jgi:hypothetical protein
MAVLTEGDCSKILGDQIRGRLTGIHLLLLLVHGSGAWIVDIHCLLRNITGNHLPAGRPDGGARPPPQQQAHRNKGLDLLCLSNVGEYLVPEAVTRQHHVADALFPDMYPSIKCKYSKYYP